MQTTEQGTTPQLVGAAYAVVLSIVPDWVMSFGERLLFAGVTAFLGGFAYKGGQALWNRLSRSSS